MNRFIPWAEPEYFGNERKYALEAIDSTWISGGIFINRLEEFFENLYGTSNVSAVANGSASTWLF